MDAAVGAVSAAFARLKELHSMIDVDTDRDYDAGACGGRPLRESLLGAAKKLGHEFVRFTLVLRATGGAASALADTVPGLAEATATLVAGLQLISKPGAGATLQADYRKYGRAITQAVLDSVQPIASGEPLSDAVVAAQSQRMLHRAGVVLQLVDQAERLPVSNAAAVRRRLLLVGKLSKASADDIAREQGGDDDDTLEEGSGKDDEENGGAEESDEEDEGAGPDPEALRQGSDALRTTAAAVRVALEASDAVTRAEAGAASAGAAGSGEPGWPDSLAEVCDALQEAVVDFAAAVSDGEGASEPAAALWAAVSRLGALCDARAPPELAAQLRGLREVLAEQLRCAAPPPAAVD